MPATSGAVTPSESLSPTVSPTGAVTPTVGQTVSVPEGPAPVLPAMPAQAQEMTNEGAEAFVVYWYDLANYAVTTGDIGPMMTHAAPQCASCQDLRDQIVAAYSNGGVIIDNLWTLGEPAVTIRQDAVYGVEFTFDQSAGLELDGQGVVEKVFPTDHKTLVAVLQYHGGQWWVEEIANP